MLKTTVRKRVSLKKRRLEKGYTQEQLALAVDVSKEQIRSLEYGRVNPSFKLLKKICTVLDSKADDLF